MTGAAAFRGQPLLLLGGLLAVWVALRVALWQPPLETPLRLQPVHRPLAGGARVGPVRRFWTGSSPAPPASGRAEQTQHRDATSDFAVSPPPAPLPQPIAPAPFAVPEPLPLPVRVPEIEAPARPLAPARFAVGHNLLLAAGLARMEVPAVLLAYLQNGPRAAPDVPVAALAALPPPRAERSAATRWSADGWLLLRRDTAQSLSGPILSGRPSYGRSQAGAVVRYRLAPASPLRPEAHLRASAALAGARERELAAGLSARPLPGVPLRLIAEARASETGQGTRLRPAVYAVSEFPPLPLPLGARAEAYVQAGYIGGAFATAFADGQARIERPLARLGETELSAGGGAWGGAQKGSARLDIGPTAAVAFRLGDARGRVAADYRFRVAGDAEPSSGPALTLSAGF